MCGKKPEGGKKGELNRNFNVWIAYEWIKRIQKQKLEVV